MPPFLPLAPSPLSLNFEPSFTPFGIVTVILLRLETSPVPLQLLHLPPLMNFLPKQFGHVWVVKIFIILLLPVMTSSVEILTSVVIFSPF